MTTDRKLIDLLNTSLAAYERLPPAIGTKVTALSPSAVPPPAGDAAGEGSGEESWDEAFARLAAAFAEQVLDAPLDDDELYEDERLAEYDSNLDDEDAADKASEEDKARADSQPVNDNIELYRTAGLALAATIGAPPTTGDVAPDFESLRVPAGGEAIGAIKDAAGHKAVLWCQGGAVYLRPEQQSLSLTWLRLNDEQFTLELTPDVQHGFLVPRLGVGAAVQFCLGKPDDAAWG
ncbi:hypothetical protein [Elioraea sp.]|uniref:hypothetical protein n=1 Tax=Elioraea sp. TaxID=2185103 RepID=UPI0025C6235D|nr:hypothetical protein [Elioraea sp.]